MGFFDGNGKTVANFTVDCRGAGYGGFFGCTKNAKVTGLTLDYILKGAGGGTVGSMASSLLAMPAADIGVPLLAMHSARELMGLRDQDAFCALCEAFFSE